MPGYMCSHHADSIFDKIFQVLSNNKNVFWLATSAYFKVTSLHQVPAFFLVLELHDFYIFIDLLLLKMDKKFVNQEQLCVCKVVTSELMQQVRK